MPTSLVMTFIGLDRPGLVSSIASRVAAHEGAWLESRLARLAGHFAGIVRVEAAAEKIEALSAALRELEREGLRVTIEASAAPAQEKRASVKLELLCLDRPGIVSEVTETISSLGVNIEEFESDLVSAAFTGEPMFKATARLYAPATLGLDELRRRLEKLAGEMMMADISLSDEDHL
jgi:glycine cleavage system regulatory protein